MSYIQQQQQTGFGLWAELGSPLHWRSVGAVPMKPCGDCTNILFSHWVRTWASAETPIPHDLQN